MSRGSDFLEVQFIILFIYVFLIAVLLRTLYLPQSHEDSLMYYLLEVLLFYLLYSYLQSPAIDSCKWCKVEVFFFKYGFSVNSALFIYRVFQLLYNALVINQEIICLSLFYCPVYNCINITLSWFFSFISLDI